MKKRILIIDDDKNFCLLLVDGLKSNDYEIDWFINPLEAKESVKNKDYHTVLMDVNMPLMNGIEFCEWIALNRPNLPVIIITAFGSFDSAVSALRAGAYNFITKPVDIKLLELSLKKAIEYESLQEKVEILTNKLNELDPLEEIIGDSQIIRKLCEQIKKIAKTDITVLISGESGTGKELVAKSIHSLSMRNSKPFIAINCAAIPETLIESELFGYKKGAFSGAVNDYKGLLMQADGGTLFLDEIAEIPVHLQSKFLRSLEERIVKPLSSEKDYSFDARIIAATNRNLESEIKNGNFREDLFYRLNVIQLEVPPLRMRDNDILLLAQHFIQQYSIKFNKKIDGMLKSTAQKLLNYSWPGNIRELKNVIEGAFVTAITDKITVDDIPEKIQKNSFINENIQINFDPKKINRLKTLKAAEESYISEVMKIAGNNQTTAAKILGIDRTTLYRKLKQMNYI